MSGVSGGVWGLERGFCLMIGGDRRGGGAPRPDLLGARARGGPAHRARPDATATRHPEHGYLHCGPSGAGPFREDGPQRHRIRPDGRLRRRAEHPAARERRRGPSAPPTPRRRRCGTLSSTATTSISRRSPRFGGEAAWSRRGCSTSRRKRSRAEPRPRRLRRSRLRLRRGAVDARSRRSTRRFLRRCSRARCSSASRRAARPTSRTRSLGDAARVRRPPGEGRVTRE